MRFKNILSLLILIGFYSCNSAKSLTKTEYIIGKYNWYGFFELGKSIQLFEDSSFKLDWQVGLLFGTTKGIWKRNGNRILLNSEIQPRKDTTGHILRKIESDDSKIITIKILDIDSLEMPYVPCKVNFGLKEYFGNTDSTGTVRFNLESIDRISATFLGMKPIVYYNKDKLANSFVFIMLSAFDDYQYLTNKELVIKNNRLYDYSIKMNRIIKSNYYVKVIEK
jgi:hypothetical protein